LLNKSWTVKDSSVLIGWVKRMEALGLGAQIEIDLYLYQSVFFGLSQRTPDFCCAVLYLSTKLPFVGRFIKSYIWVNRKGLPSAHLFKEEHGAFRAKGILF